MTVPSSSVDRTNKQALSVGKTPIALSLLAVAVAGSAFVSNIVGKKPYVGLVAETRGLIVASSTGSLTASGSSATAWLPTPFDSTASQKGYRTGSGVAFYLQADVVRNPTGAPFDCVVTKTRNSGSGSSVSVFNNLTATGSFPFSMSGFTMGPTTGFACYTNSRINSNTSLRLRMFATDSDVTN